MMEAEKGFVLLVEENDIYISHYLKVSIAGIVKYCGITFNQTTR
jgi:hypothetical protein